MKRLALTLSVGLLAILAACSPGGSTSQVTSIPPTSAQSIPTPMAFATEAPAEGEPVSLAFDEFYDGYNMRTGLILSEKLRALDGQQVIIDGYMAPPLKPELDFFVLTRVRLAYCPFCSTAADWPDDIALVYMNDGTTTNMETPLRVSGRLELGVAVDDETGMVSLVRVYADKLEALN